MPPLVEEEIHLYFATIQLVQRRTDFGSNAIFFMCWVFWEGGKGGRGERGKEKKAREKRKTPTLPPVSTETGNSIQAMLQLCSFPLKPYKHQKCKNYGSNKEVTPGAPLPPPGKCVRAPG